LDGVLDIQNRVAGLAVDGDVGYIARVEGFDMEGLGSFEDLGKAMVLGLGGRNSCDHQEHEEDN
jgi:hypothetical protein